MKKLIVIITALLISTGWSQKVNQPEEPIKKQEQTVERSDLGKLMEGMPVDAQKKIQNKLAEAKQAEKMLGEGEKAGVNTDALMEQKRTQNREQIREAVEDIEGVSEATKAKIMKAVEENQNRLQERKVEMKELKK